ncbi:hypothetical protein AB1N83_012974 [Pleurotus pulmonarius]
MAYGVYNQLLAIRHRLHSGCHGQRRAIHSRQIPYTGLHFRVMANSLRLGSNDASPTHLAWNEMKTRDYIRTAGKWTVSSIYLNGNTRSAKTTRTHRSILRQTIWINPGTNSTLNNRHPRTNERTGNHRYLQSHSIPTYSAQTNDAERTKVDTNERLNAKEGKLIATLNTYLPNTITRSQTRVSGHQRDDRELSSAILDVEAKVYINPSYSSQRYFRYHQC